MSNTRAARLARLKVTHPGWSISSTPPEVCPRQLVATALAGGRRIEARDEDELEERLTALSKPRGYPATLRRGRHG